jgi:hypothetical protein
LVSKRPTYILADWYLELLEMLSSSPADLQRNVTV